MQGRIGISLLMRSRFSDKELDRAHGADILVLAKPKWWMRLPLPQTKAQGCLLTFIIIAPTLFGAYHLWEINSELQYFREADPDAVVTIDKVAWQSPQMFSFYETILFHTSDATMQKVIQHYKYQKQAKLYPASTSQLSRWDINHAGGGRYRNITRKPAATYSAYGPESFADRELYWDATTGNGCIDLTESD